MGLKEIIKKLGLKEKPRKFIIIFKKGYEDNINKLTEDFKKNELHIDKFMNKYYIYSSPKNLNRLKNLIIKRGEYLKIKEIKYIHKIDDETDIITRSGQPRHNSENRRRDSEVDADRNRSD